MSNEVWNDEMMQKALKAYYRKLSGGSPPHPNSNFSYRVGKLIVLANQANTDLARYRIIGTAGNERLKRLNPSL